jgi:hypothetical protein
MTAFVPESAANEEAQAQADARALSDALDEVERPSAAERLAASRERMREWMIEADGGRDRRRRAEAAAAAGRKPPMADRLHDIPVLGLVVDALSAWWSRHPLHGFAGMAQGAAQDRLGPLVRQHPLATLAGAFVVGMLVVRLKPWRWLAKSAVAAGMAGQIISRAIAAIPLEALIGVLLARRAAEPAPPEAQAAAAEAAASAAAAAAHASAAATGAQRPVPPVASPGAEGGEPRLAEDEEPPPVGAATTQAEERARVREGAPAP